MLLLGFFFAELSLLFILSQKLTSLLFIFLHRLTRSTKIATYCLSLLFFPGTLLHEFSHALMARFLFVPIYHMEFVPKLSGETIKMGSVSIAKSDIIRRLLIGVAPFFIGTAALLGILYLAVLNHLFENRLFIIIIGYLIFTIGNTLFSSKKDLEGAIEFLVIIAILAGLSYLLGFRFPALNLETIFANSLIKQLLQKGVFFLMVPVGIDLLCVIMLSILRQYEKK